MISKITGLEPVGFIKNMKEVFQLNWPVKNEGLLYIYLKCKDLLSKINYSKIDSFAWKDWTLVTPMGQLIIIIIISIIILSRVSAVCGVRSKNIR